MALMQMQARASRPGMVPIACVDSGMASQAAMVMESLTELVPL